MIINCPNPNGGIIKIDSNKLYSYRRIDIHDRKKIETYYIIKPKLILYLDGEGYGTMYHYGWVFIIHKIIKKRYNVLKGDRLGTLPDLAERVKEVKE